MANPQLSKRLQLHSLWVTSCEAEGARLDLAGENLRNAQLPKAVLVGARLIGVDFRNANLAHADFTGADLRDADLRGARLEGADFSAANVKRIHLRGAKLTGANLELAHLNSSDLSETVMTNVNLTGALLRGANLQRTDMSRANLRAADLSCADLRGASLRGADLGCADLMGANLEGAIVDQNTNFEGAKVEIDDLQTLATGGESADNLTAVMNPSSADPTLDVLVNPSLQAPGHSGALIGRTLGLCLLSAFGTAPLFAQTVTQAIAAPAPVAYVYIGTSKGINLYNAAPNGKLTLVSGSPFKTTGLMIGSNQKYFISLGTYWVRSYLVKSNGAIGAQVSQINTQSYSGHDCGTTNGAILDHSGQDVYVLLNVPPDGVNVCNAFQTFKIAATSGQLTFNGATSTDTGAPPMRNLPTFLANNKFAYAINNFTFLTNQGDQNIYLNGGSTFTRESNGTLEGLNLSWRFPAPYENDENRNEDLWEWIPIQVTADATNHLAVAMYPWYDPPKGNIEPPQLASFTIDSQGVPVSTNTYKNMPLPDIPSSFLNGLYAAPYAMNMSPDGKLLAIAGGFGGLQVFHFNGAAPITYYSKVLTTDQINWIRWDNAHHLYALSKSGKLSVYTITTTSIAVAPGSPYAISGPGGLFVVPK